MVLNNDRYLYHLNTKLNFYKQILYMMNNTNNMYDIAFVECAIAFAFPGSKLDNDFLEMLKLEIESSTEEVSLYCNADEETRIRVSENQLEQKEIDTNAINIFNYQLGLQEILVENDCININKLLQRNPNYNHIDGFIDVRVKAIKEGLKVRS